MACQSADNDFSCMTCADLCQWNEAFTNENMPSMTFFGHKGVDLSRVLLASCELMVFDDV